MTKILKCEGGGALSKSGKRVKKTLPSGKRNPAWNAIMAGRAAARKKGKG